MTLLEKRYTILDEASGAIEFSDHLYGRDADKEKLSAAVDFSLRSKRALITISGRSGIGKSSLVEWIRRRNADTGVMYVEGKFDQNHKNVPYYAVFKAFDGLCGVILGEEPQKLEKWRARLTKALKTTGRLLTARIPRLAFIVKETDELPTLSSIEERSLFVSAAASFLKCAASAETPLIIFTDDAQHIDSGSAEFIAEMMLDDELQYCLWICCYRDSEVEAGHPFAEALEKIKSKNADAVKEITLHELNAGELTQMLEDTLGAERGTCAEAAALILKKTGGNPFYIKEFLRFCKKTGALSYINGFGWHFSMDAMRDIPAEENVADFIVKTFANMDASSASLLSAAAAAGNTFTAAMLAELTGAGVDKTGELCADFEAQGIIRHSADGRGFVFAHDRFQQAFYSMPDDAVRRELHRRIAAYCEKNSPDIESASFIISDNYYLALGAGFPEDEKPRVLRLLLASAKKAEKVSAFDTALRYILKIFEYLPKDCADHDFIFPLLSSYHSILCGLGRYAEADGAYEKVKNAASGPIELADSCSLHSITLTSRGRYEDAFMLNAGELEKLGIKFERGRFRETLPEDTARFIKLVSDPSFPGLRRCGTADEEREGAIGKLMSRNIACGLFFDPAYSAWASITHSLRMIEKGYSPYGLSSYISTCIYFIGTDSHYHLSYKIAKEALRLAEENDFIGERCRIYHIFSLSVGHWFEKAENVLKYARETHRLGNEIGDFEYASYSFCTPLDAGFVSLPLSELKSLAEKGTAYAAKKNIALPREIFGLYLSVARILGDKKIKEPLADLFFTEDADSCEHKDDHMVCFYRNMFKAYLMVIYGSYDDAFECLEKAQSFASHLGGFYIQADRIFLHALTLCRKIEKCASAAERAMYKEKLSWLRRVLRERALDAPMNFGHLSSFIEAECAAVLEENREVTVLYEKAADEACRADRPLHYALICELVSQRFARLKAARASQLSLMEAYAAYKRLGAFAKCEDMKRRASLEGLRIFAGDKESEAAANTGLDFEAVIKASQALSEEVDEKAILRKVTEIFVNSTAAKEIYCVFAHDGVLRIIAQAHAADSYRVCTDPSDADSSVLPLKLLDYVKATRKILVPDKNSALVQTDPYFKEHRYASAICVPAVSKGEVTGFLYMENSETEGAFAEHQFCAIQAIVTQLSISLENAYLYENLKELAELKTQKLREEALVRKEAEEKLYRLAHHDFLTDLPNRVSFYSFLEETITACRSRGKKAALLFIDIDEFKNINDSCSHKAGDIVLRETASKIVKSISSSDFAARLGGDEFTAVLSDAASIAEIENACGRICRAIAQPVMVGGTSLSVTASIGVSVYGHDGSDVRTLLSAADAAMYKAKKNGKNGWAFFSDNYNNFMSNE